MREFHTVVVGAGPAGLLAAWRAQLPAGGLLLIDGGDDLEGRVESLNGGSPEAVTRGFGGAGLFSDGKLCLSPKIGSTVAARFPAAEVAGRQAAIDELLRGGEPAELFGADDTAADVLSRQMSDIGLEYLHYPVRHVGTDQLPGMLRQLRARLAGRATIACRTWCLAIRPSGRRDFRWEVDLQDLGDAGSGELGAAPVVPERVQAKNVVLAPGKVGASWLERLGCDLGLPRQPAEPKLGFRLEGPREFLAPLMQVATDPKVIWKSPEAGEVRTHCACYGGDVVATGYQGLTLVGGHATSGHAQHRSNCAVIGRPEQGHGLSVDQVRDLVAGINHRHGGRVVTQRLGDLLTPGRDAMTAARSSPSTFEPSLAGQASAGDFTSEYPPQVVDLLRGFIRRLARVCPGVLAPDNRLFGPAVERWAHRFAVADDMSVPGWPGLYLVGDGPGLTGGIIGAAETGWLAGDAINAAQP